MLAVRVGWFSRYVGSLVQDQGWNLRVAERLASGEVLYVDVAWAYGPLPVEILALLFRLSPSVLWSDAVHAGLAAVALAASFLAVRPLVGGRAAGAIVLVCAVVGVPIDLVTYQVIPYTSAVAWGSAMSLVALAAALFWRQSELRVWFAAASLAAALAVLSKPEFGLAAAATVISAGLMRSRRWGLLAAGSIVLIILAGVASTVGPASWSDRALVWRGYTGYDLVARGTVPLHGSWRVLAGGFSVGVILLIAAGAGRRQPALKAIAAILGVGVISLVAWYGDRPGSLTRGLTSSLAVTTLLLLIWVGWRARGEQAGGTFWLLVLFSLLVNARFLPMGSFCPTALAPTAAIAISSLRRGSVEALRRSMSIAVLLLVVAVSVLMQARLFRLAAGEAEIDTTLGRVTTVRQQAEMIGPIQDRVRGLPPGALFVAGWGPGWYLVTGRANDTRFDLLLPGLGTTAPEALELADDLAANPPSVLLVDTGLEPSPHVALETLLPNLETAYEPIETPRSNPWRLYSRRAQKPPPR
jgi:hypothetical protein